MSSLLPPSIRDERFLILEQVVENLQAIDLQAMEVYDIDNVTAGALYHLADQFNVLGLRGWLLADTEQKQRDLVKEAIKLHRKSGTAFAIRRSMTLVGYPNAVVTENPDMVYDGSWSYNGDERYEGKRIYGFVVTLDVAQSAVTPDKIELVIALINEWKNARSKLLDLRIGNVSLFSNLLQYDGTWRYNASQEYDGVKNLLIHEDSFTTVGTVLLSAHTPDFAQPGFAYVNGAIGSCTDGVMTLTAGSELGISTAEVTNLDVSFSAFIPTGFNVLLRRNAGLLQDVRVAFNAGGSIQIRQADGGPSTLIVQSTGYTVPTNTWLTIRLILFEATFRVLVGGVERVSTTSAPLFPHANLTLTGINTQFDYISIRERTSI